MSPASIFVNPVGPTRNAVTVDTEIPEFEAIDWENGGLGTTIIDIGHQLLLRFVNPAGELAIPEARAFYTAYFAVRPMAGYDARAIFDSGVMTALFFIGFGDAAVKWQRVTSAIRNRDIIMNYLVEWARPV